jgi:hypothetical protein
MKMTDLPIPEVWSPIAPEILNKRTCPLCHEPVDGELVRWVSWDILLSNHLRDEHDLIVGFG